MSVDPPLENIQDSVRKSFDKSDRIRSFQEFMTAFCENPRLHLRTSPQYALDMIEFFGTREGDRIGQKAVRYRVFDRDLSSGESLLVGQERVQGKVYQHILACAKRGRTERMLLLHGPNGSGKTTVVECLVGGLERYSRADEGELVTFNWIFTDRDEKLDKIGFDPEMELPTEKVTYAHLAEKDVSCKVSSELRDHPIFLIPRDARRQFVEEAIAAAPQEKRPRFPYEMFLEGGLSQKNKQIFDTLLLAYRGDWKKVIRHVQVERFYISKRYRRSAVSIEPQGNVDASVRPIQHENSWNIPPILRNLSLYEPVGDIVDANRGILEYSDFLKRPIEASKYLLTTCERGTVSLNNCMAYLDILITGTTNEKQLSVFKRNPDFSSFKGRIELASVPYLLRYSTEAELYRRHIRKYSRSRCVAPHSAMVAALWAVLTRLKKPVGKSYSDSMSTVAPKLTPMEKATLYDSGKIPERFSEEERKTLRAGVMRIRQEFDEREGEFEGIFGAEYEGRRGASAREMLFVLARAAEMGKYRCLTPMATFEALEELIKDASVYDFLRIPADGDYHDVGKYLKDVQQEYFRWVTDEVYDSIDLIGEGEYDSFFREYFRHVKAYHTGESVYNANTNTYEPAHDDLMNSVEKLLQNTEPEDAFRSQIIMRIAAWSLDHPQQEIDYQELFPEIYTALRDNFYRERDRLLTLVEQDILKYGTDEFDLLSAAEQEQVRRALNTMKTKYKYCDYCARDVIAYVLKYRQARTDTKVE